jgi:hypothetical protein
MAWKVYGYMEGKEGNPRFPHRDLPVYGPLPRKRWVRVKGERYKVKHKATNSAAKVGSAKEYTAQRATLYAEWLAQRDGLTIPEGTNAVAIWDGVEVEGKWKARVRAVEWKCKRYSYSRTETVALRSSRLISLIGTGCLR